MRVDAVGRHIIGPGVQLLRVEPVPTFAAPVPLAQPVSVVAAAAHRPFGVIAVGRLPPVPGVARMVGDAELAARRREPAGSHVPTMSRFGPTRVEFQAW